MASREDLTDWVYDAVNANGGKATLIEVAKFIWLNHEVELRNSGDLFFTWQYEMRWAAQRLRDSGKFRKVAGRERGVWEIAPHST
jgi:hypothetical protein